MMGGVPRLNFQRYDALRPSSAARVGATPAAPAVRDLGSLRGTRGTVRVVNRTFEWGVAIATFMSVLSVVPRHCTRLTCCLHPNLRKIKCGADHCKANPPPPPPCGAQQPLPMLQDRGCGGSLQALTNYGGLCRSRLQCPLQATPA